MSLLLASPDAPRRRRAARRRLVRAAARLHRSSARSGPLRYRDDLASLLVVLGEVAFTVLAGRGHRLLGLAARLLAAHRGRRGRLRPRVRLRPAHRARSRSWPSRLPWALEPDFVEDDLRTSVQWAVEVLLVALVAGYARRISGEADQRQILALDRLGRLSDANALLFQLHQVTQTLPASLDLDEVLDTTMEQLRELFDFDAVAAPRARRHRRPLAHPPPGGHPPARAPSPQDDLPRPLARAVRLRSLVSEQNLLAGGGPGISPERGVGPLRRAPGPRLDHRPALHRARRRPPLHQPRRRAARRLRRAGRAGHRQRPLVRPPAHRRRRRGAHPHRPRPPRPHRPVARLPRLRARPHREDRRRAAATPPPPLDNLRTDVRGRDRRGARHALRPAHRRHRDARACPPRSRRSSSGCRTAAAWSAHLRAQETGRLPILQERELWRIAQEAVTNVERHARATQVTISWRCDGTDARLEVADDGIGFPVGQGRAARQLRPPRHAGAGRQHRRHPRRRLRAGPGHAGTLHPRRPVTTRESTRRWRWHGDDPGAAGRRPPHAPRGAAPLADRGGLRHRRRGRERRAGRRAWPPSCSPTSC